MCEQRWQSYHEWCSSLWLKLVKQGKKRWEPGINIPSWVKCCFKKSFSALKNRTFQVTSKLSKKCAVRYGNYNFLFFCSSFFLLFKSSLIFPLSVACVYCFSSKMKLMKTCLRNQLGETTLRGLLQTSTESTIGFDHNEYEYFAHKLKRLNSQMRMKL